MSNDTYNPKRPAWDSSKEGVLPEDLNEEVGKSKKIAKRQEDDWKALEKLSPEERLNKLDEMSEEATALANSRAADLMTPEQQFINSWQKEVTVAESSLKVFSDLANKVEKRQTRIAVCKRTLAVAFYKLGRFEQAKRYATVKVKKHIEQIQKAINKPDSELHTHSCQRQKSKQDDKVIELDRHWATEEVISPVHGKLVYVWKCQVCRCLNATPDKPERQVKNDAVMLSTIHSLAKGDRPNARGVIESPALRKFEAGVVMSRS